VFDKIAEILEWIMKVVPRIVIIEPYRKGVRVRWGKYVKILNKGLYVYWPVTTMITPLVTVRQTINLPNQYVVSSDGKPFGASGVVVYRVLNAEKALYETHNIDIAIGDVAMCGIRNALSKVDSDTILKDRNSYEDNLMIEVRDQTKDWGIKIMKVSLMSIVPVRVLGLMSSDGINPLDLNVED